MSSNDTRAMTLRLPVEQADQLALLSFVEERPIAEIVRDAVGEYVIRRQSDPRFMTALAARVQAMQAMLEEAKL